MIPNLLGFKKLRRNKETLIHLYVKPENIKLLLGSRVINLKNVGLDEISRFVSIGPKMKEWRIITTGAACIH